MERRTLLQILLSLLAFVSTRIGLKAHTLSLTGADTERIRVLAAVVLPQEIGRDGRNRAVENFLAWVRAYRPNAETDHGYGFPRVRRTPPSPETRYRAQLDALDADARKRGNSFVDASPDEQRALVEAAITAAGIERLPERPDGGYIATDLMAFYFESIEANDLCYRSHIGRDTCRGLAGSEHRPAPLTTGGR